VRENNRTIIRHDETERFRRFSGGNVRSERRGSEVVTVTQRAGGVSIVTVVDADGRLVRRARRLNDGREIIIIDNSFGGRPPPSAGGYFVDIGPPRIRIPRERYIVEAEGANEELIYGALTAPPVDDIERAYTLDEVRYSPNVRARMPSVDIDTITFESGSWEVTPDQVARLSVIANAIRRAIGGNPNEVFLIEGHTDAVGPDVDNLSLSDRRAESVATILTQEFQIPPENLTTQGYGEQYLKEQVDGPSRVNRRVTARRITPLLTGEAGQAPKQ
jgi:outer membrane protein OmpA-like peptidoglycan-associated protein